MVAVSVKVRALAVMVAVPAATPVTTPDALTVATSGSDESHVTVSVAPAGASVAVRLVVSPTSTEAVSGVTVMPVAGMVTARVMVGDRRPQ